MAPGNNEPLKVVQSWAGRGTGETVYRTEDGRVWIERMPCCNETAPPTTGVLVGGYILRTSPGMSVYVDNMAARFGRMIMCHMLGNTEAELHAMADRLIPLFPPHECYVELFCGGAALYFLRPVPAPCEILNDVNGDLINLYRPNSARAEGVRCNAGLAGNVNTENDMSKTMIDKMVDRFLAWKLPDDFGPDSYIMFDREKAKQNPNFWPVGTNLFTTDQARAMVKHMLADAMPADTAAYATEEEGDAYTHGYFDGNDAAALKINAG